MTQGQTTMMTQLLSDNARKMGDDLRTGSRNVFLAGLGVYASAWEQARKTYDRMVDKGREYEKEEKSLLIRTSNEIRELTHRLETNVRGTVGTTLHRAGVPSRDEILDLSKRVEELTKKVEDLAAKKA